MVLSFINSGLMDLAVREPSSLIRPIAQLLGSIYNVLFNLIYGFTQSGSLGIAIILFTLLVKLILTPLLFKQQHSSYLMQRLQPEMNKIRKKYEKKKDPESQQKMAFEMQEFQKKNGISLLGGCLPLLVQLPILYALFYIFQQAYLYVDVIHTNYNTIAEIFVNMPFEDVLKPVLDPIAFAANQTWNVNTIDNAAKMVNELTLPQWETILSQLGSYADQIRPLLDQKNNIEYFMGIHLVYKAGLGFPGILIPLCSAGTTYLSSWIMTRNQNLSKDDPTAGTMKMMNTVMPVMMGVMTITMPAGLGLYWTVSNIFQVAQTVLLQKYFKAKDQKLEKGAA